MRVIYTPGSGGRQPGWMRVRGELAEGTLTLKLPRPATVTYRQQTGGTLDATYRGQQGSA